MQRGAEQPGQALQRVDGAEDVVDRAGSTCPARHALVEREQIAAEPLDDLLRLGEELVARAVAASGITPPRSEHRRRRRRELRGTRRAVLRGERLGEERVGAERQAALPVALRGLGRDDDEQRDAA